MPSSDWTQGFREMAVDFVDSGTERVAIAAAPLAAGFFWHEPAEGRATQFITETELFPPAPAARRRVPIEASPPRD